MADGKFPRPYANQVPQENAEPMMEYVNFDSMGIGARKSAMPGGDEVNNLRSLDHVGKSATGSGSGAGRKWGGK